MISLFGAASGMVLGTFPAWRVNGTFAHAEPDSVPTTVPFGRMVLFLPPAGLVGVLAARLEIRTSIRTDWDRYGTGARVFSVAGRCW
ncbi:hypothetical protein [Streptomyces puniciscabiei]|uniref:hypothetical protein n=1 Tax=Streptomyces puniciscabiei TaxID=164348 RepID=UPI003327B113